MGKPAQPWLHAPRRLMTPEELARAREWDAKLRADELEAERVAEAAEQDYKRAWAAENRRRRIEEEEAAASYKAHREELARKEAERRAKQDAEYARLMDVFIAQQLLHKEEQERKAEIKRQKRFERLRQQQAQIYEPRGEELEARCLEVQETWSRKTRIRRLGSDPDQPMESMVQTCSQGILRRGGIPDDEEAHWRCDSEYWQHAIGERE